MLLYHGTNGAWVQNIIKHGLEPRGRSQTRNNWKHVPHQSNSKCVYLTDSYAPYFAFNASRGKDPMCAVVEVNTDLLDEDNLYPDEDFLEQSSRRMKDPIPGTMSERTLYYRKRQFEYNRYEWPCVNPETKEETTWWQMSLKYLGTCSHRGTVPPGAITRIVVWPHKSNALLSFIWDPTITLMNQAIMGDRYRILARKLMDGEFKDPATIDQNTTQDQLREWRENPRILPIRGFELIDLRK